MAFNPFSQLTSKIFGVGLILSLITLGPALYFTRATLADVKEDLQAAKDWQLEVISAVAVAADNPKVDGKTAIAQIQELGHTRVNLTNAIEDQNEAIVMIEQQSADALAIAEKAQKQRAAATRKAEALAAELRDRARVAAPADDMEAAVRKTQDELYEAGI